MLPCHLSPHSCPSGSSHEHLGEIYNFKFQSYIRHKDRLPGYPLHNGCHLECQNIHKNIKNVVDFINHYLGINLVNKNPTYKYQASIKASINVIENIREIEWKNACLLTKYQQLSSGESIIHQQLLFGQRTIDSQTLSYGTDITLVAHECCHALISQLNKFPGILPNNSDQAIALEESLCDILAILVRNYGKDELLKWQWDVGIDFETLGTSERYLDQPIHLEEVDSHDHYQLSLVHSHAFYLLINAQHHSEYLFNGSFALQLFRLYIRGLVPDADFSKSRRDFERNAKKILEKDPLIDNKLQAISQAFDEVGIYL